MQNNKPLKKRERPIKYFKDKIDLVNILNIDDSENITTYAFDNNKIKIIDSKSINTKNFFQVYSKGIHKIYSSISELLSQACLNYQINKSRQFYYLYGKVSTYTKINNKFIYDFPGIDIPVFHGFVVLNNSVEIIISNSKESIIKTLYAGEVFMTHPANLIQMKVELDTDILEYYVSPCDLLSNNELNLWVPIL